MSGGYPLKILRIDLTTGRSNVEEIDEATARKYVGGTGLGAKFLCEEVPPEVGWDDRENRMMWFTGPLAAPGFPAQGRYRLSAKDP